MVKKAIFTSFDDYLQQIAATKQEYWKKTAAERWPYLTTAIGMAQVYMPESVLEIGAASVRCVLNSTVVDYDKKQKADVHHDITDIPWPFQDKQFDMVMALQVFEHLKGAQKEAFAEVKRIARSAILSIPYNWHRPGNCHHMLNEATLLKWTGMQADHIALVGHPGTLRLIARYSFD